MKLDTKINFAIGLGICIPPLVAMIMWLSDVSAKANAANSEVQGLQKLVLETYTKVTKIETYLEVTKQKGGK